MTKTDNIIDQFRSYMGTYGFQYGDDTEFENSFVEETLKNLREICNDVGVDAPAPAPVPAPAPEPIVLQKQQPNQSETVVESVDTSKAEPVKTDKPKKQQSGTTTSKPKKTPNVYLLFRSTKLKEYASLPASERKEKIAAEWEKVNSDPAQLKEWKRLNEEKYADRNC